MFRRPGHRSKLNAFTVAFALFGATMTSAAWAAVANPTITGPIPNTDTCSPNCPFPPGPTNGVHVPIPLDGNSNLAEFIDAGFTEEEFFFSETATACERDPNAAAWDSTGFWTARPSTTIPTASYESRMLVRKPADPSKFNGIVIVEWLNVTAGVDLAPDYGYAREELLRDGFIWVGVSAQLVSVNGGFPPGFGLKSYDPVRYGPGASGRQLLLRYLFPSCPGDTPSDRRESSRKRVRDPRNDRRWRVAIRIAHGHILQRDRAARAAL